MPIIHRDNEVKFQDALNSPAEYRRLSKETLTRVNLIVRFAKTRGNAEKR